jgi:hypothetical protein
MAGVLGLLVVVGAACLGGILAPTPEPPLVLREAPPSPTPVTGASWEPGTRGARLKGLFDGAVLELLGHDRGRRDTALSFRSAGAWLVVAR